MSHKSSQESSSHGSNGEETSQIFCGGLLHPALHPAQRVPRQGHRLMPGARESLDLRARKAHLLVDAALVHRERLVEHLRELAHLARERLLLGPRAGRVEDARGHAVDGRRDLQPERLEALVLCLFGVRELAGVDRVDDAARVLEWAALAGGGAELAADPARVDEPAVDIVLGHALREHGCVARGVEDDEGAL